MDLLALASCAGEVGALKTSGELLLWSLVSLFLLCISRCSYIDKGVADSLSKGQCEVCRLW